MLKSLKFIFVALLLLLIQSCVKDDFDKVPNPDSETEKETETETETEVSDLELTNLQIPVGFEFKTYNEVSITINDNTTNARYDIYAYNDTDYIGEEIAFINDEGQPDTTTEYTSDVLNQLLFTGIPSNGLLERRLPIPAYYSQLYLRRKEGKRFSSEIIDITNGAVNYTYTEPSPSSKNGQNAKTRLVEDYLFCVNGSGELFQINPLNGVLTYLSDMPMGSYTAAIDQANNYLYAIGRSNPHPLMRYDILNDSWETMGNVGRGGPRLEFNTNNGLLYFSNGDKLYTIDPNNGRTISTWQINGLRLGGGDLAFSANGTIFLSTFAGLYRLELDNNNEYEATRISADQLPFNPTSMTFDSNDELWLANSSASSDLIIMDTQTGGWEYAYGPNAANAINFNRTINDLTTYRVFDEEAEDPDTDGDGITDSNDEYPEDADKAFEQFTPSKYGWGTVAFEDLWPYTADYDFNDTAINYRCLAVLNAQNEAVQLDIYFEVTSDGAGLVNAFGIEFESISPGLVESVTGAIMTENYINIAANGTEEGQNRAVVIFFDNNNNALNVPGKISIKFTTPLTTAQIGIAPFNSFLIVNRERGREIHLPNRLRTSLGENAVTTDGVNRDVDGNYQTDSRLPWAINIYHNFKAPKEKVPVNEAYNFFSEWATSGGTNYTDWYKDNSGYRNTSKLKD